MGIGLTKQVNMPGNSCSLCKSSWDHTVSMFSPPIDQYMRSEWEAACGMKLSSNSRVCAKHFSANDFASGNLRRTRLTPDAVPSLNFPKNSFKRSRRKPSRATVDQLEYFVAFARKHPKIMVSRFGAVRDLWEELAEVLNVMGGAFRTAEKWKESMGTWRSQLRCRARRGRSSGVQEFDEFAICNFGEQDQTGHSEREFPLTEYTDDEITSQPAKKFKMVSEDGIEVEVSLDSEAEVEIKKEIDCSDTEYIASNVPHSSNVVSEPEVALELEAEIDIGLMEEESLNNQPQNTTELENLPTLGFTRKSRSESVGVHRSTTSLVTSIKSEEITDDEKETPIMQASTASNNINKTIEEASNKREILPRPTSMLNKTSQRLEEVGKKSGVVQISPTSPFLIKGAHSIAESSRHRKGNKLFSTYGPITVIDTPKSGPKVVDAEIFTPNYFSQSASSPTTHVSDDVQSTSKKSKATTLNAMYETVLKSIKKREDREDQIMTVLQGLTVAVNRLADNVKKLDDVLVHCVKD